MLSGVHSVQCPRRAAGLQSLCHLSLNSRLHPVRTLFTVTLSGTQLEAALQVPQDSVATWSA